MLLIGAEILKYRKAANMNQEEFAAKIGVSRQAVSKWELDKAYPDLDKLLDICKIFGITLDELVHGKTTASEELVQEADEAVDRDMKQEFTEKTQRKRSRPGLMLAAVLLGVLFLFCGTVLAALIFGHAWNTEYVENARVERVYRQYTKADISFYDDEGRKVMKTLWLDMEGVRDGDFIECYTDRQQDGIYYNYYLPTLLVPGICTALFLILFLFVCTELRRLGKEEKRNVPSEEEGEKESVGNE